MLKPPLRVRVRYITAQATDRIASRLARVAAIAARLGARVGSLGLVVIAAWFVVTQPVPDAIERDALIGVAGILATVLSIGLGHTARRATHG